MLIILSMVCISRRTLLLRARSLIKAVMIILYKVIYNILILRFNIYLKWDSELDIIINSHLHLSREWMWCYCGKVICYQAMRTHVYMIGNTCSRWWWYFLTRDTKILCMHFSNFYDLTKIPCKYSLQSYHAISDSILSICAQCTRLLLFYDLPVPAINV